MTLWHSSPYRVTQRIDCYTVNVPRQVFCLGKVSRRRYITNGIFRNQENLVLCHRVAGVG